MYITWSHTHLATTRPRGESIDRATLTAKLSESKRVAGKPKRRVVANLGHIEVARLACAPDQVVFWRQAERGLAQADVAADDAARFVAELEAKVSRPNVTALADNAEWYDLLVQSLDDAEAILPDIPLLADERARRSGEIHELRTFYLVQEMYAGMREWLERLKRAQKQKHRREFRTYLAEHPAATAKEDDVL